MNNALLVLVLAILFYLLGRVTDLVIVAAKKISELFGLHIVFLGILLGFFTSLPEFSIAVNAIAANAPDISLGNLLGGIVVLFSLVLGGNAVLNRKINTDGKIRNILPILAYILLPLAASLDGNLNATEGFVLIAAYLLLLFYLFRQNRNRETVRRVAGMKTALFKNILLALGGVILVIVVSNLIVRLTLALLENWNIPAFAVGLLVFSIGTNLPELAIMFRAWSRNVEELSVGNLLGSAIANVLIIGILASARTIPVAINASFLSLFFFLILLCAAFALFYKTDKKFARREGGLLLAAYAVFIASQVFFLTFKG